MVVCPHKVSPQVSVGRSSLAINVDVVVVIASTRHVSSHDKKRDQFRRPVSRKLQLHSTPRHFFSTVGVVQSHRHALTLPDVVGRQRHNRRVSRSHRRPGAHDNNNNNNAPTNVEPHAPISKQCKNSMLIYPRSSRELITHAHYASSIPWRRVRENLIKHD